LATLSSGIERIKIILQQICLRFRWVKAPTSDELTHLTHTIAYRVTCYLERQGLLERDAGHTYLTANGVDEDQTPAERRSSMTWANRPKRVFDIDIETCSECGGDVKIIASIEDPAVISKILAPLNVNVASVAAGLLPECPIIESLFAS